MWENFNCSFVQAGRDFKFVSLAMSGCFCLGALLLLVSVYPRISVKKCTSWNYFKRSSVVSFVEFATVALFTWHASHLHHQLISSRGFGLPGCWCALVGFQWVNISHSLSLSVIFSLSREFTDSWTILSSRLDFSLRSSASSLLPACFMLRTRISIKLGSWKPLDLEYEFKNPKEIFERWPILVQQASTRRIRKRHLLPAFQSLWASHSLTPELGRRHLINNKTLRCNFILPMENYVLFLDLGVLVVFATPESLFHRDSEEVTYRQFLIVI